MLFDPRHEHDFDKTGVPVDGTDWSKPSLEGFAAFVAFKVLRDPNAHYDYLFLETCPVGEYLHAIGCYTQDHPSRYPDLDELACGGGDNRHWRDARGRFTSESKKVGKQWNYSELWNRIRDQFGPSRLKFSVTCEIDKQPEPFRPTELCPIVKPRSRIVENRAAAVDDLASVGAL